MAEASPKSGAAPHRRPDGRGISRPADVSADAAVADDNRPASHLSKMPRGPMIALGLVLLELAWLGLIGYGIVVLVKVAFG